VANVQQVWERFMEPSGSELRRVRRELDAFRIAVAAAFSAHAGVLFRERRATNSPVPLSSRRSAARASRSRSAEPIRELLAVGAPDFEAHGLNTPRPEECLQLLLLTSTAAANELRAAAHRA
jgi:hypothetical protein